MSQIPQSEIDSVIRAIRSNPQYLDPDYVIGAYRACGLDVIPDPFPHDVLAPVRRALTERRPLSVIRIGDGEANLMTTGSDGASLLVHVVWTDTWVRTVDGQWVCLASQYAYAPAK